MRSLLWQVSVGGGASPLFLEPLVKGSVVLVAGHPGGKVTNNV